MALPGLGPGIGGHKPQSSARSLYQSGGRSIKAHTVMRRPDASAMRSSLGLDCSQRRSRTASSHHSTRRSANGRFLLRWRPDGRRVRLSVRPVLLSDTLERRLLLLRDVEHIPSCLGDRSRSNFFAWACGTRYQLQPWRASPALRPGRALQGLPQPFARGNSGRDHRGASQGHRL